MLNGYEDSGIRTVVFVVLAAIAAGAFAVKMSATFINISSVLP